MQMGCASHILHVDANSSLPLIFDYHQGSPRTIGLMIIARPLPPGNPQDPQCGMGGSSGTYFFNDNNYPQPATLQQPYADLVNRGWVPVDHSHYVLYGSQQNPCAQ